MSSKEDAERKEKIDLLEKELTDLRQGLCIVQDYYHDLKDVGEEKDAEEDVDRTILKPLIAEDAEFEGIWKFHDEMLIRDPASAVSCLRMYDTFVAYCGKKGRSAADRPSFEFMLAQMGMQREPGGEIWKGYRIRG